MDNPKKLKKGSTEYWQEVTRLADLLREWEASRSKQNQDKVVKSMKKLNLIVPMD
jgi:hypothetical protein